MVTQLLSVDVLRYSDLPLLISKSAMKRMSALWNFTDDDQIELFGNKIRLVKSGLHSAIDILDVEQKYLVDSSCNDECNAVLGSDDDVQLSEDICLSVDDMDGVMLSNDREKALTKIHRNLGHPSQDRMAALLKNGGMKNGFDVLTKVYNKCDGCHAKKRKLKAKPQVCCPLATDFNNVLCMDLFEYTSCNGGTRTILHIIDYFTRYSTATVISDKTSESVVNGFFGMLV